MVQVRRHNIMQHETGLSLVDSVQLEIPPEESLRGFSIIFLVGANPLYQKALKLILNDELRSNGEASFVLHGCSTVEDFETDLSDLSESQRQSVIIFLIDEGGEPASTIKNIDALKKVNPSSKIIVISNCKNVEYINRCIEKGINAYILSDISEDLLIDSMCLVAHDHMVFPAHIYRHNTNTELQPRGALSTLNNNAPPSGIDEQEATILGCLALGMSNKEISRLTGLSNPTIKSDVRKILTKIGAKNRVQAAIWAEKNGYSVNI